MGRKTPTQALASNKQLLWTRPLPSRVYKIAGVGALISLGLAVAAWTQSSFVPLPLAFIALVVAVDVTLRGRLSPRPAFWIENGQLCARVEGNADDMSWPQGKIAWTRVVTESVTTSQGVTTNTFVEFQFKTDAPYRVGSSAPRKAIEDASRAINLALALSPPTLVPEATSPVDVQEGGRKNEKTPA